MFPFRNILFPTDFSAHAHAGLKYAAAFARHGHGRVFLLNARDAKVPTSLPSLMTTLASDPLLNGVDTEAIFVAGEPSEEIAHSAIEHGVDLITVVMRERNRLSRAFGASIAEEIVAESPCAVLAIRPPQRDFVEQTEDPAETRPTRYKLSAVVSCCDPARNTDLESVGCGASCGLRDRRLLRADHGNVSGRRTRGAYAVAQLRAGAHGPPIAHGRRDVARLRRQALPGDSQTRHDT